IDIFKLSSSSNQAINSASGSNAGSNAQGTSASGSSTSQPQSTASLTAEQIWSEIQPKGIPAVYGDELGVSYDKPEAGISILYQFDDYGPNPIQLSGEKLQRYIGITTSISCEYCCGASTIGTSAGTPACGCAHSAAMRGLAKYLLDKHPEISDEQILEELGKLKVLYFPANSIQKAAALKANNLPLDYISISSNKYRGLESQVSSNSVQGIATQVGGC
ncbi:MAG: hypothetical protein HZA83_02445, partial [Thaumarchaeota archaeon]|nr:hypothetical protein [Nitrososphaerota archaeon]